MNSMYKQSALFCMLILSTLLHAQPNNTRLNSPEILTDNSVIFRIKAPGASSVQQVSGNITASKLPPLPLETHKQLRTLYDEKIRPAVRGVF